MESKHGKQAKEGHCHRGTWVMGSPVPPHAYLANPQAAIPSANPYIHGHEPAQTSNTSPYVLMSPIPGSTERGPMEKIVRALDRCGKRLEDTTRKAGGVAGNIWHHLKTSSSPYDAAMARLAQGTKVLVEGGNEKIFQQIFGTFSGEQLHKAYACYLSTSSGPLIGTLYVSTRRLAFCSDSPLYCSASLGQQEWVYYKVVVQLDLLRAVNPSANLRNPAEKYIQIVTRDNHEFWFMGFVSYDKAFKSLTEALHRFDA